MEFKTILKYLISDMKVNQEGFAKITGFKQGQISEWLAGKNKPNYDNLKTICLTTGVSPSVLLGLED